MYKSLTYPPTKDEFDKMLSDAISILKKDDYVDDAILQCVKRQLEDINTNIENLRSMDSDEVDERYDFGSLAINNLEWDSELQNRITDLFWCIINLDKIYPPQKPLDEHGTKR